jgi:Protein of unknown function (DUF2934)
MARKTKLENDRVVSPEAAAARPHRQTTTSRARRAAAPAATPVPPAVDGDAEGTLEKASIAATPKPRRKTPAPRTKRSPAKIEKSAAPVVRPRAALAARPKTDVRLAVPAVAEPSREAIAALAYLYWQARGGQDGSADEDWLRAERELRQQVLRSLE